MTVTLTEENKKHILEDLTVEACEHVIEDLMNDIERVKRNDPEDFFGIIPIRQNKIDYYKLAIKLIEDAKINFKYTEEELDIIIKIVKRIDSYIPVKDMTSRVMDIAACHLNGCRLDLKKLLNLDRLEFLKDIAGITVGLDRTTGKLTNGFRPRSAA